MARFWERKWEAIGSSHWCGSFLIIVVGEPTDSGWGAPIFSTALHQYLPPTHTPSNTTHPLSLRVGSALYLTCTRCIWGSGDKWFHREGTFDKAGGWTSVTVNKRVCNHFHIKLLLWLWLNPSSVSRSFSLYFSNGNGDKICRWRSVPMQETHDNL